MRPQRIGGSQQLGKLLAGSADRASASDILASLQRVGLQSISLQADTIFHQNPKVIR
jgi:hypothetical protein